MAACHSDAPGPSIETANGQFKLHRQANGHELGCKEVKESELAKQQHQDESGQSRSRASSAASQTTQIDLLAHRVENRQQAAAYDCQILSVPRLLQEESQSSETIDMVEINLTTTRENSLQQQQERQPQVSVKMQVPSHNHNHNQCQQYHTNQVIISNGSERASGFARSEPKLFVTSGRLRDYIESLGERGQSESLRLYQFFKSSRSELLASLLFVLITSQVLISCRCHFGLVLAEEEYQKPTIVQTAPSDGRAPNEASASQEQIFQSAASLRLGVHLISGLVMALTVASLTQAFGHISGCHLIPSVSLALYVKGHIKWRRLVAYLAAQLTGSLMAVGLLALLTSSLLEAPDWQALTSLQRPLKPLESLQQSILPQVSMSHQVRRRKRSQSDTTDDSGGLVEASGSEMLLLSIMEQMKQQRAGDSSVAPEAGNSLGGGLDTAATAAPGAAQELGDNLGARRDEPRQEPGTSAELATITELGGRAIAADIGTSNGIRPIGQQKRFELAGSSMASSATRGDHSSGRPRDEKSGEPLPSGQASSQNTNNNNNDDDNNNNNAGKLLATEQPTAVTAAPAAVAAGPTTARRIVRLKRRKPTKLEPPIKVAGWQASVYVPELDILAPGELATKTSSEFQSTTTTLEPAVKFDATSINGRPELELASRKRHLPRSVGLAAVLPHQDVSAALSAAAGELLLLQYQHQEQLQLQHHRLVSVNLLELALPDSIMFGNSPSDCFQHELNRSAIAASRLMMDVAAEPERQFQQLQRNKVRLVQACLASPNASQMFVYQLLGSLVIVLTYLVNVDPRRVDAGFKSLSIGFAYFVASALTIQSGGLFANPFQLIFVSLLASRGQWRSEWIVYLVTPLIAGLFGAMSHDYFCDYSSPNNRDRLLQLRRSFCSLNNLAAPACQHDDQDHTSSRHRDAGGGQDCAQEAPPAPRKQSIESIASSLLSIGASGGELDASGSLARAGATLTRTRGSSMAASGSDSASVVAEHEQPRDKATAIGELEPLSSPMVGRPEMANQSGRLLVYKRQLNLEHQQHQQATSSQLQQQSLARESDFDSNFLISRSPPTRIY